MNKSDIQSFFKRRMVELLDKHTLDSYRVRTNNSMTILKELRYVLVSWVDGNVKRFETVEFCINECKALINKDDFVAKSIIDKSVFIKSLDCYLANSKKKKDEPLVDETNKMIYWVDELYECNDNGYLLKLLDDIQSTVLDDQVINDDEFLPKLKKLDFTLSSFACELLRIGYSKVYLYKFFKALLTNKKGMAFEDAIHGMCEKFANRQNSLFTVIIPLEFCTRSAADTASSHLAELSREIPEILKNVEKVPNNIKKPTGNVRLFVSDIEALDAHSAAVIADEILQNILDSQQEDIRGLKSPSGAVVFQECDGEYVVMREQFYDLDTGGEFMREDEASLHSKLKTIRNSSANDVDIKDRLFASLRHLRIGDAQTDIDQQFINYWIALEFIFASSSRNDNTYQRIKDHLVRIMTVCYVKRNLLYLKNWAVKTDLMRVEDNIVTKVNDDAFVESVPNILLRYRLKSMKANIRQQESIKEYIKMHETNLLQHLSRIYRLRNELVHEAAIKQDIVNVTSNLRYYLVFVINQMVGFFSDSAFDLKQKSMLKFFWTYEKYEMLIEQASDKDKKVEALKNVKIYNSYII